MKNQTITSNVQSKLELEQSRILNEFNLRIIQELSMLLQTERDYNISGENSVYNRLGLDNNEILIIKNKMIEYVNKL